MNLYYSSFNFASCCLLEIPENVVLLQIGTIGGFPKLRGTFLGGIPVTRSVVVGGLQWCPPIFTQAAITVPLFKGPKDDSILWMKKSCTAQHTLHLKNYNMRATVNVYPA